MKIAISIGGRFHAFDLAKQLQARGHLHSLITSYPRRKTGEWGIEPSKVQTILSHELLSRAFRKLGRSDLQYDLYCRYDRIAARRIRSGIDLLVAWSSMALSSITRARKMGAKAILERNSAHICRQRELLQEEAELTGARVALPDQRTIDRELEEYETADSICVPSTFAYRSFVDRGFPPNKLLVVSFGVDAQQFSPSPKRDKTFRIIHCGSLTLRKGIHYLLQAFHELQLKDAELWLIGQPSSEVRPFLRRYEGPNVILKGTFPQSLLYEQYSQGSVLCMASIEEGLAMVIPQAMVCGLPVICTLNTGAEDIVRDSTDGYVIPIRNVEILKERLSFLYANQNVARQMGESARRRILGNFTWDHYGERIVSEYSRVSRDGNRRAELPRERALNAISEGNF